MLNTKFLYYFLHLQTQSKYLISSGTIIIIFVLEIFNNTKPEDKGPQRSERELSESPWSEDDEAIKVAPTPPSPDQSTALPPEEATQCPTFSDPWAPFVWGTAANTADCSWSRIMPGRWQS